jgi:hypothetical protein
MSNDYDCYLGSMDYEHKNPPAPFNPDYDPRAKDWFAETTASLEAEGFYKTGTPASRKEGWRKRYEEIKAKAIG